MDSEDKFIPLQLQIFRRCRECLTSVESHKPKDIVDEIDDLKAKRRQVKEDVDEFVKCADDFSLRAEQTLWFHHQE